MLVFALVTQAVFLSLRLETWDEVKVILLFHITGTVMEVFKLAQGSWDHPETGVVEIGGVPLFAGFMFACVGSYIARVARWMPLPVAAFLAAVFLWIAENVGTFTKTWVYAGQGALELASLGKLGSWYLLLYVSLVTVTLVMRKALQRAPHVPQGLAGWRRAP